MANKKLSAIERLAKAREIIKDSDLKKAGHNSYSNYDYYTPEQVEELVANACKKTGTIVLCNLKADENGYYQTLEFVCLDDPSDRLQFELRTEKGEITATSNSQQMGGTDTYSERYIKMKVFQIKDNNLDPDSQEHKEDSGKEENEERKTVEDEQW